MKHCIKGNSKAFRFILTLLIIGLLAGIILYLNLSKETKDSIIDSFINLNQNLKITKQNNIIYHLFILSSFVLLGLTLFLYPITLFYIFYEILSFGFVLAYYTSNFNIGGTIYTIIHFLINKFMFILVLIYISFISYKLIIKIIKSLTNKDNISVRELYQNYFKKILICAGFILLIDIFVYFFGNKILSLFQFLL